MRSNLAEAPPLEDLVFQADAPRPHLSLVTEIAVQDLPADIAEQEPAASRPNLYIVPDTAKQDTAEAKSGRFINADSIPELAIKRQRVARDAARILGQRRHLLHNGNAEYVPKPIEVLGTTRQVGKIKQEHGVESPEYVEGFGGLVLDCERLIGEVASRSDPEHFARKRQELRLAVQEYFSHGLSISNMTENGLSPTAEPEEQPRRINERVEENGTYIPIGVMIAEKGLRGMIEQLRLPVEQHIPRVSVQATTISECTDSAIRNYKVNPKGAHGGYRPAMEGIAIRRVHFEDDSGDREEEQVIISGIYITHDIIEEVLAEEGAIEQGQKLTKTELHGSQFLTVNDGSVVEFVRKLDEKASEAHDKNIFMGEEVLADHPKDYYKFIEEAEERRKRLAPLPVQLAEYLSGLEEGGIDDQTAETLTNEFLKDKLLTRAKEHPELAEAMFDKETAEGLAEVARLDAAGRTNDARQLEQLVRENAPDPSYCGASNRRAKSARDGTSSENEEDEYGSLNFECPNGHTNTRLKGQLIDSCRVCGISVKC